MEKQSAVTTVFLFSFSFYIVFTVNKKFFDIDFVIINSTDGFLHIWLILDEYYKVMSYFNLNFIISFKFYTYLPLTRS